MKHLVHFHHDRHPACRVPFDQLESELEARVRAGLVRKVIAPFNDHLALYCYTQRAVVDRAWDTFVEVARGIVLDTAGRRIAALPFPKFFNYGEREEVDAGLVSSSMAYVTEKLDGSLAIVFFDQRNGVWRCATKGSFTSPQALSSLSMLSSLPMSELDKGVTYLFEVIYRADRKVIAYPFEGLVLLGAYSTDERQEDTYGLELHRVWLDAQATRLHVRVPVVHELDTVGSIVAACDSFGPDREGFVVRFYDGGRLKFKGREYLRVHRLISNVTPLFVWDALRNHDNLAAIRADLPEEFWNDFDCIVAILRGQFETVVARVVEESKRHEHKTDKELGLSLKDVPTDLRPYAFAPRKHGPKWFEQPKTWGTLWASIRPTGNVLDGYAQSSGLRAIQSEV